MTSRTLPLRPVRLYDPDTAGQEAEQSRLAADLHAAGEWMRRVPPRFAEPITLAPVIERWVADTLLDQEPLGLLLLGPTGTGKTHQAWTALMHLRAAGLRTLSAWKVPRLLEACRPGGDPLARRDAEDCGVLLLDELAVGKVSEWTEETLYLIVDHRYEHQLPIVATVNVNVRNLEDRLGSRLASRLLGMTHQVVLDGTDHRRTR